MEEPPLEASSDDEQLGEQETDRALLLATRAASNIAQSEPVVAYA